MGHDFKDQIAPECLWFRKDHYEMGNQVGRVLFLKDFASFIKDDLITELTDFPRNMMLSIDIIPVATDEAIKEIQKRILALETDITRWQARQNAHFNFTANIPYEMEQLRKEFKEMLDDIINRDQRMIFALVTLTHLANDLEQLNQDTEALEAIGRGRGLSVSHAEISTGGWIEYGFALWPAPNRGHAHPDDGKYGGVNAF